MRFRWTMKALSSMTDLEIIRGILAERRSDCTNVYSPLYKKLSELYNKVEKKISRKEKEL